MAIVALKGFIIIPDNNREQILLALDEHIRFSRAEAGCLKFEITPDDSCPDKYWVDEVFVNRAAFEYHQARIRSSRWGKVSRNVQRVYEPLVELTQAWQK